MKYLRLITVFCISSLGILSTLAKADNPLPEGSFEASCRPNLDKGGVHAYSHGFNGSKPQYFSFDYDGKKTQIVYAICKKKLESGGGENPTQETREIEMTNLLGAWKINKKPEHCFNMKNDDGVLRCE